MSSNNNQSSFDEFQNSTEENLKADEDTIDDEASQFETGNQLANDFLATISGSEVTKSSAKRYGESLRSYISHLNRQDTSLKNATSKHVNEFFRATARNNLSTSTLETRKSAILRMYKHFRIEQTVDIEMDILILEDIDTNNYLTRDRIEKEPLSEGEIDELCDQIDDWRNRFMVLLDSEIGARNEALRLIELNDVCLSESGKSDDIIHVPNTKTGGHYPIPISNQMAMALERWIQTGRKSITNNSDNPYLFPSRNGGELKGGCSLRSIVCNAAEDAGIQEVVAQRKPTEAERRMGVEKDMIEYYRVTPHLLRHTFSHILEEADLDTKARRDALDHQSIETTRKYYSYNESEYEQLIRESLHQESSLSN